MNKKNLKRAINSLKLNENFENILQLYSPEKQFCLKFQNSKINNYGEISNIGHIEIFDNIR